MEEENPWAEAVVGEGITLSARPLVSMRLSPRQAARRAQEEAIQAVGKAIPTLPKDAAWLVTMMWGEPPKCSCCRWNTTGPECSIGQLAYEKALRARERSQEECQRQTVGSDPSPSDEPTDVHAESGDPWEVGRDQYEAAVAALRNRPATGTRYRPTRSADRRSPHDRRRRREWRRRQEALWTHWRTLWERGERDPQSAWRYPLSLGILPVRPTVPTPPSRNTTDSNDSVLTVELPEEGPQ